MAVQDIFVRIKGVDKISGMLGGIQGKVGKLAGVLKTVGLIGGVALVAVGVAALKLGGEFDKAYDTIRTGTGATGKAFEGLKDDFKSVFADIPTDMASASTAVADLNTRLGLTGEPLQILSKQMLELSRITKTDVATNIEAVTRLFGDWDVATDDQSDALDRLFRTSQSTGIGVDKLSQLVVQFGAPLRNFGFSLDDSTALLAKFEKEGVNTEAVMGGLKIGLGQVAAAGKDPAEAFAEVSEAIKNAGSSGEANIKAIEMFGSRAGPDMAAAIREGRFEIEDFVKQMDKGGDGIMATAKATESWTEKLKILKNKALIAVEPAVTGFFNGLTKLFVLIEENLVPILKEWWKKHGPKIVKSLKSLVRPIKDVLAVGWEFVKYTQDVIEGGGIARKTFEALPVPLRILAASTAVVLLSFQRLIGAGVGLASGLGSIVGFVLKLAVAVGAEVFLDFVDLMDGLLINVIVPLVEKTAILVGAVGDLGGAFGDNEAAMRTAKNILVPLVEAWLLLIAAKKIVTLTQNIVRSGQAFINFLTLKKNQVQNLTQAITRSFATGVTWITSFAKKTQDIVQNVLPRLGKKWITDFAAKTQAITQTVFGPDKNAAERSGQEVGRGFVRGLSRLIVQAIPEFLGGASVALIAFGSLMVVAVVATIAAGFLAGFLGTLGFLKLLGKDVQFIKSLDELGDTLGVQWSIAVFEGFKTFFVRTLPRFFTKLVPFLAGAFAGLIYAAIVLGVPALFKAYKKLMLSLQKILVDVTDTVVAVFVETIPAAIADGFEAVVGAVEVGWDAVKTAFSVAFAATTAALGTFITSTLPKEVAAGFPTLRKEFTIGLKTVFIDLPTTLIKSVIPTVTKFFTKTLPDAIVAFLTEIIPSVVQAAFEVGESIIDGLLGGIGDVFAAIKKPFEAGFTSAVRFAKDLLGISSPSTVFWAIGRDIIRGLGNGISSLWSWALGKVGAVVIGIIGAVSGLAGKAWRAGYNMVIGLWNGIKFLWGWIKTNVGVVAGTVAGKFSSLTGKAWRAGYNMVIGLWNGIKFLRNWIFSKVYNFARGIFNAIKNGLAGLWPGSPSEAGIDIGVGLVTGIEKGLLSAAGTLRHMTLPPMDLAVTGQALSTAQGGRSDRESTGFTWYGDVNLSGTATKDDARDLVDMIEEEVTARRRRGF